MKKFMLGSLFTLLVNYCVGSTVILYKTFYKGSGKRVRTNAANANTTD